MTRPRFSLPAFLQWVFHPSKNPKPTGMRKTIRKGRSFDSANRIKAWNRLPAEKQRVIIESGKLDAFLRGDVTYTECKRALRERAVREGVAKPLRVRTPKSIGDIARHIIKLSEGRPVFEKMREASHPNIRRRVERMSPEQRRRVMALKSWDDLYAVISGDESLPGETNVNPYWLY